MDRETLFWSLVFSVPPGVGIVGFTSFIVGRSYLDPLAIGAGLFTTLVIFSVVAFAVSSGAADESRENEISL